MVPIHGNLSRHVDVPQAATRFYRLVPFVGYLAMGRLDGHLGCVFAAPKNIERRHRFFWGEGRAVFVGGSFQKTNMTKWKFHHSKMYFLLKMVIFQPAKLVFGGCVSFFAVILGVDS